MDTIPEEYRDRWCEVEGPCACLCCVQVGNRLIMVQAVTGRAFRGDPENIDERKIPSDIFEKYKITREEWDLWLKTN